MREKNFAVMLDAVTDFEDALRRMVDLCRDAGEDEAASAATSVADGLHNLERIMIQREASITVPEYAAC